MKPNKIDIKVFCCSNTLTFLCHQYYKLCFIVTLYNVFFCAMHIPSPLTWLINFYCCIWYMLCPNYFIFNTYHVTNVHNVTFSVQFNYIYYQWYTENIRIMSEVPIRSIEEMFLNMYEKYLLCLKSSAASYNCLYKQSLFLH